MTHDEDQSPGRILLIDDQPELIEGFRLLLEDEGFEATVHPSLITLPLVLRSLNPDVILLDLSMPALSGQALFATGVHRLLRTSAPIVLFSGRSPRELSEITEEIGADGFVSKAQDLDDAIRRIRLWVMKRRASGVRPSLFPPQPKSEGLTPNLPTPNQKAKV